MLYSICVLGQTDLPLLWRRGSGPLLQLKYYMASKHDRLAFKAWVAITNKQENVIVWPMQLSSSI